MVVFNPDQWRGDVLGHLGNPGAETPNLDRFVEEGAVSFRNAFCQIPVCVPSRCSFMTGWYPHTRGHRTMHYMLHAERGEPNLLRLLREDGYYVWWGGKNHFLPGQFDLDQDCDVKFEPSAVDYIRWGYTPRPGLHAWEEWRGSPEGDRYYSFFAGRLDTGDEDLYFDEDWAQVFGALEFIQSYRGDQPFCLFLPLFYPHPPYGVEEPWYSLIDRTQIPPHAPAPADWSDKPAILRGLWNGQNMQGWSEERWTELRAAYYGMCARLDHQFGLVMTALKDAGLYEDTAVFMFSDHGDFTGDFGLVEKTQNTFEEGLIRVPFILKPPRDVPVRPRVSEALVELVDFPATVFDLAGLEPAYSHFGRTLLPLLDNAADSHREAVFSEGGRLYGEEHATENVSLDRWHADPRDNQYFPRLSLQAADDQPWHTKAAMCRTSRHKYVRRLYEQDELYDLERDPKELRNLITDPAYQPILGELKERMLTWYMETSDVVPWDLDSW